MKVLSMFLITGIVLGCLFINCNAESKKEDFNVVKNKIFQATTNSPKGDAVKLTKEITAEKLNQLNKSMTINNIIDIFGLPDKDLGSGVYYYVYNINDKKYTEAHLIFKGQYLDEVKLVNEKENYKMDLKDANKDLSKKPAIKVINAEENKNQKNSEKSTNPKKVLLTYDKVKEIQKNTSVNDVLNVLGSPDEDLGSGAYNYVYYLNDQKYKEVHFIFEGKYLKSIEFIAKTPKN